MRRLLEIHPDGMQEWFHWSEADRSFAIEYVEPDLDALLTRAREESADTGGWSKSRELRHVMTVPVTVHYEMIRRYGADPFKRGNEDLKRRVLRDPEWRYLTIGRII
jgi:hypothetical protein